MTRTRIACRLVLSLVLITEAAATNNGNFSVRDVNTLVAALDKEQPFNTVALWRVFPADCFIADESNLSSHPKLLPNAGADVYLSEHYRRDMLAVVCLRDNIDLSMLEHVAESLQHMRSTRTLFLLQNVTNAYWRQPLEELFAFCHAQQMLNVLAIFDNFSTTGHFYSYTRFPEFEVELRQWPAIYYPNRLQNLRKSPLYSMPSQSEPGSIVYKDKFGRQRSSGYVFHLVANFAAKLNATLTYKLPVNVGASIENAVLANLTSNYELDLPISLAMPYDNESMHGFSDIVDITNWMPMLPRVGPIERYRIYHRILSSKSLLTDLVLLYLFSAVYCIIVSNQLAAAQRPRPIRYLDILLNDKMLRGLLGQSFQLIKQPNYKLYLIYFTLFLQGLIWSTIVSAYLNTYYSQLPNGSQIDSFDDFKTVGIKIVIPATEFELLQKLTTDEFMGAHEDIFIVIPSVREFYTLRKSLNPAFAYSTHTEIWAFVEKQQRYFAQRLFRVSENVQFRRSLLMAIPLAENSIYREAFNSFVQDMKAFGFWTYWTSRSLFEMVEAGKLGFEDVSAPHFYRPLGLKDFWCIWIFYLCASAACLLSFGMEIVVHEFWSDGFWQQGIKRLSEAVKSKIRG